MILFFRSLLFIQAFIIIDNPFGTYFSDPNLCSHLYALCFIAQSLFDHDHQMQAKRCSKVCPHLSVFQIAKTFGSIAALGASENTIDSDFNDNILIGMNIPNRFVRFK